ncbi:DMT family transporter [Lichenihabitans sp. Uapishka_5]|uniref:DMT family transporter n=1 Tax=Lichenihabitans sp. Uapishka_5 TaxID=3037302 RepID=UPI0029E823BF|nr:DMT family transporter [Lichenihabitans sp. Uapishka_5]MDX7953009.1 DMT family transporter [Lichenihabitans sp. Uapishka_5]
MSRFGANAALLGAAAIWGGGFIAQADAMRGVGPLWFTVLRFGLAAAAMLPLVLAERRSAGRRFDRHDGMALLAMGVAFTAASLLQQFAITRTSVTHVGFLTGLYVLFVPLLGAALLRQGPHGLVLLAASMALGGTWLIGGGLAGLNGGDGLAVGCALGFAAQILLVDHVVRRTGRPGTAVLVQSLICAGLTLPAALSLETLSVQALPAITPALLFAGVMSGGIAFMLQAVGQRGTAPSVAAVILMSESLFAALLAVLLLGERLPPAGWLGCGLLFASLVLAQIGQGHSAPAHPAGEAPSDRLG